MTLKSRIISSIIICLSVLIYNAALMITATAYNVNLYVKIFCFLLNAPLIIATVCAVALNYRQLARWLISISILLAISAIVYYIILRYDLYSKFDSADKIQAFLSKYGAFAGIIYMAIQFLQVTFIPLPGALTTMAGVALFGFWKTFFYSVIGIISGSMVAFYLGKRYGVKLFIWLCGKSFYEKYKRFTNGRDKIVLTMMFLFPFFPDDILCIAAGLTTMTYRQFFAIMLVARPLNILIMEGAFKGILSIPLTGYGIPIWIALISLTLITVILAFKYSEKIEKSTLNLFDKIAKRVRKKIKPKSSTPALISGKSCYDKSNIIKGE